MQKGQDLLRTTWNVRSPWPWLVCAALLLSGCTVLGGYAAWVAQALGLGIAALLTACVPDVATKEAISPFPDPAPTFDVAALLSGNGSNGFVMDASTASMRLGASVSLGDINGDGFADVALGAPGYGGGTGQALVVLGGASPIGGHIFSSDVEDYSLGMTLAGINPYDYAGTSIAFVGNINGDPQDREDLAIGIPQGNAGKGEVALVFGDATPQTIATLDATFLDGTYGTRLYGNANGVYLAGAGTAVGFAGDINGDGIHDILIGGPDWDGYGGYTRGRFYEGIGRNTAFGTGVNLWGTGNLPDIVMYGDAGTNAYLGTAVAGGGNVDGVGTDDTAAGSPGDGYVQGKVFVHFNPGGEIGGSGASINFTLLVFSGTNLNDATGTALAMGDINGDGRADVIIGAPGADGVAEGATSLSSASAAPLHAPKPLAKGGGGGGGPTTETGRVHVVFGNATLPGTAMLETDLNGSNGFTLIGAAGGAKAGTSLAMTGDVNGDGYPDFLVGNGGDDGSGNTKAYVIFGSPGPWPAIIHLSQLNEEQGIVINVPGATEITSVAGGRDIDGDGIPDIVLGTPSSNGDSGRAYVILGKALPR